MLQWLVISRFLASLELIIIGILCLIISAAIEMFKSDSVLASFGLLHNTGPSTDKNSSFRRYCYGILMIITLFGWLFKIMHLPGANEMLVIGCLGFGICSIIWGFMFPGWSKFVAVFWGISLFFAWTIPLYRGLIFPGVKEMVAVVPASLVLYYILIYFTLGVFTRNPSIKAITTSVCLAIISFLAINEQVWTSFMYLTSNEIVLSEELAKREAMYQNIDSYNKTKDDL